MIDALFTVHSYSLANTKRAHLGVRERVDCEPGATLDEASELKAWRRCDSEKGSESWQGAERSQSTDDGSGP